MKRLACALDRPEAVLAIGVLLPWLLIVADPAVFRGSALSMGGSFLGEYRALAYVTTLVFTASLLLRLVKPYARSLLSGVLGTGALFSLGLGLLLLPLSLVGSLFAGLGLLGLLPFLFSYVYAAQALKAWRSLPARAPRQAAAATALAGCLLPILPSATAHILVERRFRAVLEEATSDDPARRRQGIESLRGLRPIVDLHRLGGIYLAETDPRRKLRIANAFEWLTGESIQVAVMD